MTAARTRRAAKDSNDIAFVLLHNDVGGPRGAAELVLANFRLDLRGEVLSALEDLRANFATESDQGPSAYAEQMQLDHPELDAVTLAADAVVALNQFHSRLSES